MILTPLHPRPFVAGLLLLALAGAAFACADGAEPGETLADCLDAAGVTGAAVGIRDFAFAPETLRVAPGTAVTWVNCEGEDIDPHTTTSDASAWDSGFLYPGETFTRTFEAVGENPYHCVPHPFMRGVVIVEEEA